MEKFDPELLGKCLTITVKAKHFDGANSCVISLTGVTGDHTFSTSYKYYDLPSDMASIRALVAWMRMLKPYMKDEEILIVTDSPSLLWLLTGVRKSKHNGEKWAMGHFRAVIKILKERGVKLRTELATGVFDTSALDVRVDSALEKIIRGK